MQNPVAKFILKSFFFSFPIILLFLFYIANDPFKVIFHYDSYYASNSSKPYVASSRDYISTETFFNNYPIYKYDSFIFGNSRSLFYEVADWQKHISSTRCFHFDAANESLYGIHSKITYLDQNKIPIKNALIIIDNDVLSTTGISQGILFLKHPGLSSQNRILFQMEFIKAFFDRRFLTQYIKFRLTDKIEKNVAQGGILDDTPFEYDLAPNEIRLTHYENLIKNNPDDYYNDGTPRFTQRSSTPVFHPSFIKDDQKKLLKQINEILRRNSTDYRIIINPLYDRIKFNPEDYHYLRALFGGRNVFDFSGINEITNNMMNYYDSSHYRPHVARFILDVIYK